MLITLLKSKLHRVTTTHSELNYEGSCAIDGSVLDVAHIREYEQIHIYNLTNGQRFTTYTIRAEENSGIISVNGAAAHKVDPGDLLIIASYAAMTEEQANQFKPTMLYFEKNNKIVRSTNSIPKQMQLVV